MKRFIEGEDRQQVTLLPECLDDFIGEDNPVRVVDSFVEELDLCSLGQKQIEQSIQRYLNALETADRTQPLTWKPRPSGCRTRSRSCASR